MDFDIKDAYVIVCGKRGSGKSYFCKYLLENVKSNFDQTFVCTATDFNGFWQKVLPRQNIFEGYDQNWVKKMMDKMAEHNEGKDQKHPQFRRVLLVLDDIFADKKGHQLATLDSLSMKGRHYGVTVIQVLQHYTKASPAQRSNADYIFFFKNNRAGMELLEDEFNNGNLSKKEFLSLVDQNTNDHHCFVINNKSSTSADLNSMYGTFKVPS